SDVHVLRVARIDQDRMQFRPVRRAVLVAATPRLSLPMRIEPAHSLPRGTVVGRSEQALRRGAGVPDARLPDVTRRQPEGMVNDTPTAFGKRRGSRGLFPRFATVVRTKHRRT